MPGQNLISTPLDDAVRHIIKGSHFDNNRYQYVHIARLGKAFKFEYFPLITSTTRIVSFTENRIYANLTVAIIFPFDAEAYCIEDLSETELEGKVIEQLLNEMIASTIQFHIKSLYEISMWITGKRKIEGTKQTLLDFNIDQRAYINIYFGREDPQGNDDFRNRATIYEALLSQEELIAVELNLPVWTSSWNDCCPIFSPEAFTPCEIGEEPSKWQSELP